MKRKYGTSIYLLDKRSGHLYVAGTDGCKKIKRKGKGLLYPSESMILAGALNEDRGEPQPSIQASKIQATLTAESTRIPLRTSTDKREASNQKEPLLECALDFSSVKHLSHPLFLRVRMNPHK